MVSEVGWLSSDCLHLSPSTSKSQMSGPNGKGALNNTGKLQNCLTRAVPDRSTLYCTAWATKRIDVLTSTNPTEEERKDYAAIMAKLDGYFQVRKNTIYERARFNLRNQLEGESAEQYITALYGLIGNCEYGPLKEELLRDRIVVGIRYTALWQKLQADAGLTLERAKTAIRQKEAIINRTGRQEESYLGGSSQQQTTSTVSDLYLGGETA